MSQGKLLRDKIAAGQLLHVMSAHSPLSARLAAEAGFDGLWASGFELSALYGLPDVSLLTMTQHLDMVRAMIERGRAAAGRRSRHRLRQRAQRDPCDRAV